MTTTGKVWRIGYQAIEVYCRNSKLLPGSFHQFETSPHQNQKSAGTTPEIHSPPCENRTRLPVGTFGFYGIQLTITYSTVYRFCFGIYRKSSGHKGLYCILLYISRFTLFGLYRSTVAQTVIAYVHDSQHNSRGPHKSRAAKKGVQRTQFQNKQYLIWFVSSARDFAKIFTW